MAKGPNYDAVCRRCEHHDSDRKFDYCTRPADLVTGRPIRLTCQTARAKGGVCGPSGELFEPARKLEAAE